MHMLFYSIEDFYSKAKTCTVLSRQEEKAIAELMKQGDPEARQRLVESYLPTVAGVVRRNPASMQTLGFALYCVSALEKSVDSFDFLQSNEPFIHRLSWALRQATTQYLVR